MPENVLPGLNETLAHAMSQSSRVIASMLDLEQAGLGVKQARAPMLPNASISAGFGETYNRYNYQSYIASNGVAQAARTSTGLQQMLTYNGGISQPIYHWGALKKGYQSAQLQRAIATRNVAEIRRALAIDIRRAYFNLISAANGLESDKVSLANLEKEKIFLKQQAADGFITQSTANSADVQIKNFKLQMQRSLNNFDSLWLAYCNLTGSDRAGPIPIFPKEIPAIKHDISALLQSMSSTPTFEDPVSLLNADDSIHAERLSYEITSTRLRPKLGLSLNASQGYNTPNNAELYGAPYVLTSYGASVTVNWSIFDGYSTQAAKQSSLIRLRQLRTARDQTERDFKETLKNCVMNLRFNWESLQTTELNLSSYRGTADVSKADFEAGFVPKKTWDDAKIVAENALQSANNARADYYMQIVNYLSLRGKDPAVNPAVGKKTFDAAKN
jgi:outer membrane protein TolC